MVPSARPVSVEIRKPVWPSGTDFASLLHVAHASSLDADQRPETRDAAGESSRFRRLDDRAHVFVGAGGILGDAAARGAEDQMPSSARSSNISASAEPFQSGVARHRTAGPVAG